MITEAILNVIFVLVGGVSNLIPSLTWDVHSEVFQGFFGILEMVGYLLPMYTVVSILEIVILFNIFKITISFIKTIWQLIPFF